MALPKKPYYGKSTTFAQPCQHAFSDGSECGLPADAVVHHAEKLAKVGKNVPDAIAHDYTEGAVES